MVEIKLQKGNLFNSLTGYYDFNLYNSSEYDLEITINDKKEYFRVRFNNFKYVVTKINYSKNYEFITGNRLKESSLDEIIEFRKSDFYKYHFDKRAIVEKYARASKSDKYMSRESYTNFLSGLLKKSQFNSIPTYSFYLDSKTWGNKRDLLGYKVTVENVRKQYYIVFVECIAKDLYHKDTNDILWFVYDKKKFANEKETFETDAISLAESGNYPLLLTESIMLLSGNDKLSKEILDKIKKYREFFKSSRVQKFIRRELEKTDVDSAKNSLIKILGLENYQMLKFALENNLDFSRQLIDYIMNDEDDIEFCVSSEKSLKKELTK